MVEEVGELGGDPAHIVGQPATARPEDDQDQRRDDLDHPEGASGPANTSVSRSKARPVTTKGTARPSE